MCLLGPMVRFGDFIAIYDSKIDIIGSALWLWYFVIDHAQTTNS